LSDDRNPNLVAMSIANNEGLIDRQELKELEVGTNIHYHQRSNCLLCRRGQKELSEQIDDEIECG